MNAEIGIVNMLGSEALVKLYETLREFRSDHNVMNINQDFLVQFTLLHDGSIVIAASHEMREKWAEMQSVDVEFHVVNF